MAWGFDAYTTTSSWTETGLNYTNAPARTTKLGSFPSGNTTGWISLDVTAAITTNGTYSFALVGTYWQEISLAARESGANAPQLIITSNGTPPHPTPNPQPTHQPHRHRHQHHRQPHLDRRHRQHRRHRLQPLPVDNGRVRARGRQPDRAADVDRVRGHRPGGRDLLLPRDRP